MVGSIAYLILDAMGEPPKRKTCICSTSHKSPASIGGRMPRVQQNGRQAITPCSTWLARSRLYELGYCLKRNNKQIKYSCWNTCIREPPRHSAWIVWSCQTSYMISKPLIFIIFSWILEYIYFFNYKWKYFYHALYIFYNQLLLTKKTKKTHIFSQNNNKAVVNDFLFAYFYYCYCLHPPTFQGIYCAIFYRWLMWILTVFALCHYSVHLYIWTLHFSI